MSVKINPPDFKEKNYERYKTELHAWREVTSLDKKKQGIAIALTLPEDDPSGIRETVFDEIDLDSLKKDDGFETLIKFLDSKLGKDDLADSLAKFEDFDDYVRPHGQPISEFIAKYDQKYNRIVKKGMKLPSEILGFQLLRKAKITKEEKLLVLTGMDYSKKDSLYEQAKTSLKKFKGDDACDAGGALSNPQPAIKLEPAFLAENEEALAAAGYVRQSKPTFSDRGKSKWAAARGRGARQNFMSRSGPDSDTSPSQSPKLGRAVNPTGRDGQVLTCLCCGSFRHLLSGCPHSWENQGKRESEKVVMYTGNKKPDTAVLGNESQNYAVLDSGCSSTVCGEQWLKGFLQCLDSSERANVVELPGRKTFRFGGGETLQSKGVFELPAVIAGQCVTITTDVVESSVPLLLSMKAMRKAKVKLDLENDMVEIFGKRVHLNYTSSGQCCIPIVRRVEHPVSVRVSPKRQGKLVLKTKECSSFGESSAESDRPVIVSEEIELESDPGDRDSPALPSVDQSVTNVHPSSTTRHTVDLKKHDRIQYKTDPGGDWTTATVLGRAGKKTGVYNCRYNVRDDNSETDSSVDLNLVPEWSMQNDTETVNVAVIPTSRHLEQRCLDAKMEELEKLKALGTYTVVDDVGQNRISTTWVLSEKGEKVKAQLVTGEFEENENVENNSPTVSESSIRVILAIAVNQGWPVRATDKKAAFLKGSDIEREVFLTPPAEAALPNGKLWKLRHCLNGLNYDAARQFYNSVKATLLEIGCQQSVHDPAVFTFVQEGQLIGMVASHIDDLLHSGNEIFDTVVMKKLRERVLAGGVEEKTFTYVGLDLKDRGGEIFLDQSDYINNIDSVFITPHRACMKQESLNSEEHTNLRSLIGQLIWVVQCTRPDLAFEVLDLSSRCEKATVSDLIRANKAICKLKEGKSVILFPNLCDSKFWQLVVFSDAALANFSDGVSSTGAHIVFLVGKDNKCCPLSWHANKIKRVVRSTIAAEALSLLEAIENAVFLKSQIESMLVAGEKVVSITAYVDNKSVVEALLSTKLVDDKRLRLDISAIKQVIDRGEVQLVKWCAGESQLANCMTKKGASTYQLLSVLQSGELNF